MASQNLPELIHEPKTGNWFEIGFIIHVMPIYVPNMEKT